MGSEMEDIEDIILPQESAGFSQLLRVQQRDQCEELHTRTLDPELYSSVV